MSDERSYLCVEALVTMRMYNESENELDWLLSMGLMWATDLKTGLKGGVGAVLLLAAHVVNCMPCVRWPVAFTHNARLQDDTQSWDLLLRKGGGRLSGVSSERSSSDGERERHTYDNGVVQKKSCY